MAAPASAQVVHSVQFGGGVFSPRALEGRSRGRRARPRLPRRDDPGYPNLSDALAFEIQDFRSGNVFAEWNVGFGDHLEFGAGVGVFARSVPTVYLDLVDEREPRD